MTGRCESTFSPAKGGCLCRQCGGGVIGGWDNLIGGWTSVWGGGGGEDAFFIGYETTGSGGRPFGVRYDDD